MAREALAGSTVERAVVERAVVEQPAAGRAALATSMPPSTHPVAPARVITPDCVDSRRLPALGG